MLVIRHVFGTGTHCIAPSGLPLLLSLFPGLAPWAFLSRPCGASFAPETRLGCYSAMVSRIICGFVLACGLALASERGEEVRLWPDGAPGAESAPEVSEASGNPKLPKRFTVVHYPSIFVFLPPKESANGVAMVVAPGGGHTQLVIDKEGWEIADWLNENGIAAFVLKYRLARAQGSKYTLPEHVYADAARSMRLVRSRAKEWSLDPARIGFIGFSAGGEVAGMIETKYDTGKPDAEDP